MNAANQRTAGAREPKLAQSPAPVSVRMTETPVQQTSAEAKLPLRLAIGLIGMLLASLLAILNEQVTAVALTDIRGAFSIGRDDGTWLTTLLRGCQT